MSAKDAYYFKHDSNARMDERTLELRAMYGWEGYGLYWAIIETLREQTGYRYGLDKIGGLAMSLNYDKERLINLINDCISLGLFAQDDAAFYSPSLLKRMEAWDEKREKAREAARIRWSDGEDADAMRTHSGGNANPMPIREEESKEDKSIYTKGFLVFWSAYPKKKSKGDAFKAWKQQKCESLNGKILSAVAAQKKTRDWLKDDGQFIPYPATWIRARGWEDEIEQEKKHCQRVWE